MTPRAAIRLAAALAALLIGAPRGAAAHAILVQSTPASGGSVAAGTVALEFRFNSRIDHGRSRLTLTAPDEKQTVLALAPDTPPDILRSTAVMQPGAYAIRWQVLATDGHITRGDVPFTVKGP